ncbi:MAG: DUF4149 domain-containing protein [Myxococcales bacterium]|nr:DUF4149 domain-containing protein [Myxococcales bacterium]
MSLAKGLHLLALAVWFGSMIFFSFVVAPTVFRNFPRETAGEIVGHIFPKYYAVATGAGAVALATLLLTGASGGRATVAKLVLLLTMLGLQSTAGYVIRPQAVVVKEQMHATDAADEAALAPLRARFGALHRNAMILNSIVIVLGAVVLVMSGWNP